MSSEILNKFQQQRVFVGLDGLRFLCIVAVVWHHSVPDPGFKIGGFGFLGVDLFFVISGFLIVTLLLRERDKVGSISLRNFYIRRSLRIFPLYYAVILGLGASYFFLAPGSSVGQAFLGELPIYLFYLANFFPVVFSVVWSLASEEQFYLLWPFLEKVLMRSIYLVLFGLIVVNQIINFFREPLFAAVGAPELADLEIMQATFTPILLGVLLAHLLHDGKAARWLLPLIQSRYAAPAWLALLLLLLQLAPDDISGATRLLVQIAMTLLVGSTVLRQDQPLNRVLTLSVIARVGAISYGIYLFHLHCITVVQKLLQMLAITDQLVVFAASLLLTVVVAEISFRFFESPFLKLKSRFSVVHQKHM
jgi:peptidoglycan/LPS O-acetylase OafA/YrhL